MEPGIPTLLDMVLERLQGDGGVRSLLIGGIYDRPLQNAAAGVYGATPNAFVTANRSIVRPSAVVRNQPRAPINHFAERHVIEVWTYAPATREGKVVLAQAAEAVRACLNGWEFTTWSGTGGTMTWAGQMGYRDAPEYEGSLVDTLRYAAMALMETPR